MENPYNPKDEAEVFRKAVDRQKIKTVDAPRYFGVTRHTLASWMHGQTKIPRTACIILLDLENLHAARTKERTDQIAAIVEGMKKQ